MNFLLTGNIPFSQKRRFTFTGANQSFVVPYGVNTVRVKCWGAGGAGGFAVGGGGGGGFTQADIAVTGGETLTIKVGEGGGFANTSAIEWPDGQPANWPGAGAGGASSSVSKSGVNVGAGGGGGAGDGNAGLGPQPGSPGGTSTAASPSGGGGGTRFDGGGAGGNSSTTGGTNTTVTAASGADVANAGDTDYPGSIGNGGGNGASGQFGYVVIIY